MCNSAALFCCQTSLLPLLYCPAFEATHKLSPWQSAMATAPPPKGYQLLPHSQKWKQNSQPSYIIFQYLLINPTNLNVHLKHGAVIATASLVDSNDVTLLVSNESDSHNSMAEVGSVDTEDVVNRQNLIQTAASLNIDFSETDLDTTQT